MRLAHRAKLRLLEERQSSLFPIEYLGERVQGARHGSQSDQPLPIPDARKLAETKRLTMGFQKVFGARKKMAARLFRQAVLRAGPPGVLRRPGMSTNARIQRIVAFAACRSTWLYVGSCYGTFGNTRDCIQFCADVRVDLVLGNMVGKFVECLLVHKIGQADFLKVSLE